MKLRSLLAAILALCIGVLTACSEAPDAATVDVKQLTYDEILNTGLANSCPQIANFTRGTIPIAPNETIEFSDLCLEPQTYFVKEEPLNKRREAEFIEGKPLTRYTSSLEQMTGKIKADSEGLLTLVEEDGIDFQPITVQLPGGDQVPFLFTIKNLVAQTSTPSDSINTSTDFIGEFRVPPYRGAVFLDPKARGTASGYDNAVALPSQADEEELTRANIKQYESRTGEISLQIAKIDEKTGEIAGTFESEQTSSTDMGAEDPEEVRIRGIFYARLKTAA
ncbi:MULTISPECIES: photosystem II manganese-stabilizing polypeptide [Cyanophyceae]|uniref:photosystem II manganese-stabilizing polypeptide n=1 Tax=Cyanophyceae TaxID=3028117 RepID=UPI000034EC4C|nr:MULTISPECIES: photosystem II manganese-stabilizing polypeptide [Cyanophyceae]AAS66446.1 photosystem II manganese stabilizing protein [Picosynechococcus sp. PCC 7002]ACA98279.1 photosystem II manganese stabilizing protein PsbO [Picosynechococcus sp. PCC 7002]AMA08097.1 Photosystem II manganese-stabilizing polypeptide [Picosynechococcus sp. PCC 73109]ANV86238.1 Photosystem II manganese-stabilizing polypeptide [Picosynechococcus sp. PCC 7117]QCS48914.1 Photosystem II manganese-stabilizing poly